MTAGKRILLITDKADAIVLRQKTGVFDFSKFTKKDIRELVQSMRVTMKLADGVGLSANQIGLNLSLFVAQIDRKLHAVFNPAITKLSKVVDDMEEGCLSVPRTFGTVRRPTAIWITYQDAAGKKTKAKIQGFLARVFQHEIDHLNGVLFTDKAVDIYTVPEQ